MSDTASHPNEVAPRNGVSASADPAHLTGWRGLVRMVVGPWPFFPGTVMLVAAYGMIVRLFVRVLTQAPDYRPFYELVLPNLAVAGLVTVAAGVSLVGYPRLANRLVPLHGEPIGRGRYVMVLGLTVITMSAVLVGLARRLLTDGHSPSQIGVPGLFVSTVVVVVVTVFVTNGITGRVRARLRRQEFIIASQLRSVRSERMVQLAAEERVRAETARFLHDDLQSTLLRASMRLASLRRGPLADIDREALDQAIAEIDDVRDAGIRAVGRRLSPPLSSTGLIAALRDLNRSYDGVMTCEMEFDDTTADRFRRVNENDRVALALYRIVEQALQNALKHGQATTVNIVMHSAHANAIDLTVVANGTEPLPAFERPLGDGTAILNAWLDDVGGSWSLASNADGGSVLHATVGTAS